MYIDNRKKIERSKRPNGRFKDYNTNIGITNANTFNKSTFATTYKDDFIDSDNYHRILFNSGRALQARELTQMRLSFKKRFQDLVETYLKTVRSVNPGVPTVDNAFEFIKLDTSVNTLPTDTSTLVGLEFTGSTSSIKARVIRVETGSGSDPNSICSIYRYKH